MVTQEYKTGPKKIVLDIYPFLSIKKASDPLGRISVSYSWVPKHHRRRLEAYTVLSAMSANHSNAVRGTVSKDLREYGDANFICTSMSNSVIGDSLSIVSPKNSDREEFFSTWAKKEMFFAKMVANEYKASNIGDCIYKLHYNTIKKRVEVQTLDPGFWFPENIGEKNERHTFAWEELDEDGETRVYKEEYFRENGSGDGSVKVTAAFYTKGKIPGFNDLKIIEHTKDEAGNVLDQRSLGIDFFPIVYIPNVWREGNDFGESDLTPVWRVFDELHNTYTDESANAYFMGLVQMYVEKETYEQIPLDEHGNKILLSGSNKVIPGKAGIVDNSKINEALMKYEEKLLKTLFRNTMLGGIGSGTASSGSEDRTTGIVQLKGSPFERFIWTKRLVRQAKYDKLLEFVARYELAFGDTETKKIFKNRGKVEDDKQAIQFGNILPVDQKALIENIQKVKERLSDNDFRDNIREAGIIVNEDLITPAVKEPTGSK